MKQVHIPLQSKGGIGKTVIANFLSQYVYSLGEPLEVVDADPSNATLAAFKALKASRLNLMEGSILNEANFDSLMARILKEDAHFVVDTGASSFIPLNNYLIENFVIDMISDHGKQVVVHAVIASGSLLKDTILGFADMVEQLPENARIVVWLNEHLGKGKIEVEGKPFEEMKIYLDNEARIHGIVRLPVLNPATFGADMERMLTAKLTFDEVNESPEFDVMKRSRLHRVKESIFQQLDDVI